MSSVDSIRLSISSVFLLAIASLAVADEASPLPAGSGQMAVAAQAFLSSLGNGQRELITFDLEDNRRATWSNLPTLLVPPAGLKIADMTTRQRVLLHDLLRASMSSQGYLKAAAITLLDDILHEAATTRLAAEPSGHSDPWSVAMTENRSAEQYAAAFFGIPGDDEWGWKMTGHHLAVNFTVSDGRVAFTPLFVGSNPRVVLDGRYAGFSALSHESARGVELMRSLSSEQRNVAQIGDSVAADVFEGPGRRASLERFEGLKASQLSVGQMRLLQALVDEYLRNADFPAAERQRVLIERSGWEEMYFSWRGSIDTNGEFYYRVHGPRLLIEYNRQNPNHDHAVVRDPHNDYGEDWLAHHYQESHPTLEDAARDARLRLGIE